MFGLWERKQLIKINMLNSEHSDAYFVINEKIKNSIIAKYARDNELYAMKGRRLCEDHDEFEYKGEMYRLWNDIDKWIEIKNKLKSIDDSYKDVSLEEALNIAINAVTDITDKKIKENHMSKSITFSEGRSYLESKDSISFKAKSDDTNIVCLISSEAIQYCFNNGENEGKGKAFDNNRETINKIAELKIQSNDFSAENEVFITQQDCEKYGLVSSE